GIAGARMEDIASRAAVAVGTLYNHFADRSALVAALLELRRVELAARLDAALAACAGRPFRERLEIYLAAILEHVQAHRRFFATLFDGAAHETGAHKKSSVRALMMRSEKLCAEGVAGGDLRADDAALYAPLLIGALRAVIVASLEDDGDAPLA